MPNTINQGNPLIPFDAEPKENLNQNHSMSQHNCEAHLKLPR